MILPSTPVLLADAGHRAGAGRPGVRLVLRIEASALTRTAPPSRPRRLASGLDGLLNDGAPVAFAARDAAARAFAAGSGFLPGQIIDRTI